MSDKPNDTEEIISGKHLEEFMSQEMRGKCGSCKWFDAPGAPEWYDIGFRRDLDSEIGKCVGWNGKCRRFPPVMDQDDENQRYPLVSWDDWCGEWTVKFKTAAESPKGTPIKSLGISARAIKVCNRLLEKKAGMRLDRQCTVEELVTFTAYDLINAPNCGTATTNEIKAALGKVGLCLADDHDV